MIAGIVVATLVVGLLAYVLWALRAGGEVQRLDIEEEDGTTLTTIVVRSGKPAIPEPDVPVSTPLLRAAGRHQIALASRRAVRRRRLGLVVSLLVSSAAIAAYAYFPVVSIWWLTAVPGVMLAWMGLTRLSVVAVTRHLLILLAEVEHGNDEPTKLLVSEEAPLAEVKPVVVSAKQEMSVDMDRPLPEASLPSGPMKVSPQTYVNQPTLPRSVRRVDLSAKSADGKIPRDAKPPQDELPFFFGEALVS